MNRSMQIAVLLGLLSVALVMAVPLTDMTDEVADDSEAVQATEDSLEIGEETTDSARWGKKKKSSRRRRWLKQIKTHVGCGTLKNRCMCGSSFTCWFRKKRTGDGKKDCEDIYEVCKIVGNNPELVAAAKAEAKSILNPEAEGASEGIGKVVPLVKAEKKELHDKLKKRIQDLFSRMSQECRDDAATLHAALEKKEKTSELLKAFNKKCFLPKMGASKEEALELVESTDPTTAGDDNNGFWLSIFLSDIAAIFFG